MSEILMELPEDIEKEASDLGVSVDYYIEEFI